MGIDRRAKTAGRVPRVDLNLLNVLEIVVEEGSLTRAAVRLGTTQSAVSHNIARLREMSGDPLFARTSRGIVPTLRARTMAAAVRHAMEELETTLVAPRSASDTASDRRRYLLHVPDGLDCVLLPAIKNALKPGETPAFRVLNSRSDNPRADREPEESWLGISHRPMMTDGFASQHCIDWKPKVVARKGHPLIAKRLTRAVYEKAELVALTGAGAGRWVVAAGAPAGSVGQRVKFTVSSLDALIALVESSEMMATLLPPVARYYEKSGRLTVHDHPGPTEQRSLYLVWHDSDQTNTAHAILRELVHRIIQGL